MSEARSARRRQLRHRCRSALPTKREQRTLSQVTPTIRACRFQEFRSALTAASTRGESDAQEAEGPQVTLILYDTLSRNLREFQPIDPSEVRLYCCGPTVYNFAHIGNLRTYIFEDLLRRVLEFNGFKVRHVVNITDVGHLTSDADEGEDKMEAGSRRTGETVREMAARFTRAFQEDWAGLNLREPSLWCKATDHIAEQIEFIRCIEATGCTYIIEDGVYFDTSRQPNYGFLARLKPEQLRAGARVDVGAKRRPTDFALWKFSPKGAKRQMEWQSPWGVGFPGWHIECSAMATKYLGPFFDIHCLNIGDPLGVESCG